MKVRQEVTVGASSVNKYFVYDGGNVVLDFVDIDGHLTGAAPTLDKRYFQGPGVDQLLAQERFASNVSQQVLWILPDHLGSTRDLVDTLGKVVAHYQFDSFGVLLDGRENVTRYQFTGREHDSNTDLNYHRARWYDPFTGKFTTEDPIGLTAGDPNFTRMVGNNVLNATDPSGLYQAHYTHVWVGHATYGRDKAVPGYAALGGGQDFNGDRSRVAIIGCGGNVDPYAGDDINGDLRRQGYPVPTWLPKLPVKLYREGGITTNLETWRNLRPQGSRSAALFEDEGNEVAKFLEPDDNTWNKYRGESSNAKKAFYLYRILMKSFVNALIFDAYTFLRKKFFGRNKNECCDEETWKILLHFGDGASSAGITAANFAKDVGGVLQSPVSEAAYSIRTSITDNRFSEDQILIQIRADDRIKKIPVPKTGITY